MLILLRWLSSALSGDVLYLYTPEWFQNKPYIAEIPFDLVKDVPLKFLGADFFLFSSFWIEFDILVRAHTQALSEGHTGRLITRSMRF